MRGVKLRVTNWVGLAILIGIALIINLISRNPAWVERFYSTGLYPFVGKLFRYSLGWIPLSIGDCLYIGMGVFLLYEVYRGIRQLVSGAFSRRHFLSLFRRYSTLALVLYICFNLFWGLNYNRQGIAFQLQLPETGPDAALLEKAAGLLREKTNQYSKAGGGRPRQPARTVFDKALSAYASASQRYPFLHYSPASVKPSLLSILSSYMGTGGYYNPFTGEAQVNYLIPASLQPFITCHEIAHQLGYAKEHEANFVGFLAARESTDTSILYSAYLDMFLYVNRQLYSIDSAQARQNLQQLNPAVQRDLADIRSFNLRYQGKIDEFVSVFYDRFLKLNQQPEGQRAYSSVVKWILAYYRKTGEI
jgi:hypothetical protein